jgi:hypothetical protein
VRFIDGQEVVVKQKSMMMDDIPIALDRREPQRYTSKEHPRKSTISIRFQLVADRGVHFAQTLVGHTFGDAIWPVFQRRVGTKGTDKCVVLVELCAEGGVGG